MDQYHCIACIHVHVYTRTCIILVYVTTKYMCNTGLCHNQELSIYMYMCNTGLCYNQASLGFLLL